MVRSGADSFLQGGFPYGEGLPRNGEHEIHVDMGHSRIFQHFHGVQSLGRGMFAPQQMQDAGIQGLHTQGDACHAQAAPEAHFFSVKVAGLASKENSSSLSTGTRRSRVSMRRPRCVSESMEGVPPPK